MSFLTAHPHPTVDAQPLQVALDQVGDVDLDTELQELTEIEPGRIWVPWWVEANAMEVGSVERVAVLMSQFVEREYAGLRDVNGRWAQTLRMPDGWVVEVSAGGSHYPEHIHLKDIQYPKGTPAPSVADHFTHVRAADIMWTWLDTGRLPDHLSGTYNHLRDNPREDAAE